MAQHVNLSLLSPLFSLILFLVDRKRRCQIYVIVTPSPGTAHFPSLPFNRLSKRWGTPSTQRRVTVTTSRPVPQARPPGRPNRSLHDAFQTTATANASLPRKEQMERKEGKKVQLVRTSCTAIYNVGQISPISHHLFSPGRFASSPLILKPRF